MKVFYQKKGKVKRRGWEFHKLLTHFISIKNDTMNIQNIVALSEKLEGLGFQNIGYSLLKNISFKPKDFFLSVKVSNPNSALSFQLFIQKNNQREEYELMYYDAFLQSDVGSTEKVINDIDISHLKLSMSKIDWRNAFDFTLEKNLPVNEKANWEREQAVESVIEQLVDLEKSEEGKSVSTALKLEFWSGLPYQDLFGNIIPAKNKNEISQRFYCANGQPGISVDEAYRFLQNRLLEKQILLKKKQTEKLEADETDGGNNAATGSGLLRKKRMAVKRNSKKHHQ
jgi:hypothetical protein